MDIYTEIFRIVVASFVGLIIGFERTKRRKAAGVGTFSIISVASCFLTIVSISGFGTTTDPSRIIANIITAIGFVAGGVIFKDNSSERISGITTGAEIFCVSTLGIGIGLGMHLLVFIVIILIEFNIFIASKLKRYYTKKYMREDYPD